MSMADELSKLERLRQSGALSEAEFQAAKQRVLNPYAAAPDHSLGRAANRYVSYQAVLGIIGLIVFLVIAFAVFVPMMSRMSDMEPPTVPGFGPTVITFP